MVFPVPITSVLSGATLAQLAYWRKKTPAAEPLLVPTTKESGRYLYSWADVVALRSIVYLREWKSLHKIRGAVQTLRQLEASEWQHLAQYRLVRTADSIVVQTTAGQIYDLERAPGTMLDEIRRQTSWASSWRAVATFPRWRGRGSTSALILMCSTDTPYSKGVASRSTSLLDLRTRASVMTRS